MNIYQKVAFENSENITKSYSTSFTLGVKLLSKDIQKHIYSIYGFVRLADEIVDSFHDFDKHELLEDFEKQTYKAIDSGISTNLVLQSFQSTVNQFGIDLSLIDAFLHSMKMDLEDKVYDEDLYKEYILGSAEAVGLMCLYVFVNGNKAQYEELKPYAQSLGSAFQKVNFLRDFNYDWNCLNRTYFPNVMPGSMSEENLQMIYEDIQKEFSFALKGIEQLPNNCKFGVYLVYKYYLKLFQKIQKELAEETINKRIRIANFNKLFILLKSYLRYKVEVY